MADPGFAIGFGSAQAERYVLDGSMLSFVTKQSMSMFRRCMLLNMGSLAATTIAVVAASVEEALSRASGLAIDVVSLIVFVAPSQITRKAPSGDGVTLIQVISDRELVRTLRRRPVYSEEQIGRIVDAAVRPETWMTKPRPSSPPDHVRREYDALAAAVGPRRPAKPEPKRVNVPARPRPRPSLGARIASALAEPPSPSARRPAPRRRNQRRRKSFAERLITDLAGPIVGLVVLWGVYNSLLSR